MKDEKMECNHHHMWGKGIYMVVGSFAFVYGLVSWASITYAWPSYTSWMVGGALLILIGWLKKWYWMQKSM